MHASHPHTHTPHAQPPAIGAEQTCRDMTQRTSKHYLVVHLVQNVTLQHLSRLCGRPSFYERRYQKCTGAICTKVDANAAHRLWLSCEPHHWMVVERRMERATAGCAKMLVTSWDQQGVTTEAMPAKRSRNKVARMNDSAHRYKAVMRRFYLDLAAACHPRGNRNMKKMT